MRIGGPEHVTRHPSWIFDNLERHDDRALGAQNERDYRHHTMAPQQLIDYEAWMARHPAPTQIDLTREPDHKILTSTNKPETTPPGTPVPAKNMPAQKLQAQQATTPSSISNSFCMTPLPGATLSTTQVEVAVTTPMTEDT